MELRTGIANVNDTRLYYELAGAGHPVVFIHGFALDTQIWDRQFAWFGDRFQALRYDMRGFGRSALPDGRRYTHAGDLKALLDALGIGRATILGLSMGGAVAINFALAYPESTSALVLVDSTLDGFELSPATLGLWSSIARVARENSVDEAKRRCLEDPLYTRTRRRARVIARLREIIWRYSGWHWLNGDPQQAVEPPALDRLGAIKIPTLIVAGEHDIPDIHLISQMLHTHIASSAKVVMPDTGHVANMERPRQFNQLVLSFLQRHQPSF